MSRHTPSSEMSFLDHLEDLRWHLIRSFFAVILAAVIAFLAKEIIFDILLFGPSRIDFLTYELLCRFTTFFGFEGGFCFDQAMPFTIQSRTMGGQFSAHVWTAVTAGFIISFPYVLYECWKFISPGMHENERRSAKGFIFISSVLFFLGVLFGYYVVTPLSINFLGRYQVSAQVLNEFDIGSYISLVRSSVIACGFIFELPIIIYFLTKTGIVTPTLLRKYRKFALVGILILSAIITPPDVLSQIIVAIPVVVLYEVSIYISKMVINRDKDLLKKEGV